MTPIILRFAGKEDCEDIFRWRNDQVTVMYSQSGTVQWENHLRWFEEKLNSPDTHLFIAVNGTSEKIGMVRFDIQPEEEKEKEGKKAEVSINLNPSFRSQGYGKKVLQEALDIYFANFPVQLIFARIMPKNLVSLNLFQKMGFREEGKTENRIENRMENREENSTESKMVRMVKERSSERV